MFKRLFWLMVGAGFGFGVSFWLMRFVKQTVDRFAPDNLQADAKAAVVESRLAAKQREAELRERYRPSSRLN